MASLRQQAAFLSLAFRRGLATTTTTAAASAAAAEAAPATAATEGGARRIYAACVLERLPIVKSPAPAWEVEHQAWRQERKLASGQLKRYPQLGDARQRAADGGSDAAAAAADGAASSSSSSEPSTSFETPADARGDVRTMKRRLRDKLVLLVKGGNGGRWHFPAAEHREGETIRATAERALRQAIGLPPLFFIGNAPMAHLEENEDSKAAAASKTTFFHLAQVLNDPWDVELARGGGGGGGGAGGEGGGGAVDFAWVAPDELDKYLGGKDGTTLLDLTRRML